MDDSNKDILKLEIIIKSMVKELEEQGAYSFDKSFTRYTLPDGQIIKHQYKTCIIETHNYDNEFIKYIFSRYKEKIELMKGSFLKKIFERRVLYSYLKYKNLLSVKVTDYESPDFYYFYNDRTIGVEVAKAITRQEAKTETIAGNPNRIKDFDKFSNGDIRKIGDSGYMPNQSSNISELVNIIPTIVKQKFQKIKGYKKCDKYIILVEVVNPLITFKYYKEHLEKSCKANSDEIVVVLLSNNYEENEILEIN